MAFRRTAKFRIKQAISTREELAKFNERTAQKVVTEIDPDQLYVVLSGLHGDEENDNGDYFGWEGELLRKIPGQPIVAQNGQKIEFIFQTWNGKPNLVNHDASQVVGEIVDVWPVQAEKSIDMLVKVARKHQELVKGIESGAIEDVSMGCIVGHSYCSICQNLAHDEEEWCAHLHPGKLNLKGKKYDGQDGKIYASKVGQTCYEDNRDVTGIEVSWITFGEGADPKAERKQILANKGGDAVARSKRDSSNAQMSYNPDRVTDIRDGSVRRAAAAPSATAQAAAASVASAPDADAMTHSFRHYIKKFGSPSEKAKFGVIGTEVEYGTATELIQAINEGKVRKTAAIEGCVRFGLAKDPDDLTANSALKILAKAADVDLVHEQTMQAVIEGDEEFFDRDAQATGGEMGNEENVDSGDQAVTEVKHEEGQPEQEREPTEPIEEQTTDGDFTITEPEGGGPTDIPLTKAKRRKADGNPSAPNADEESGTGDLALDNVSDAPSEEFPDGHERPVNEPVVESVSDGDFPITESDTSTSHQEGELPYVGAVKKSNPRLLAAVQRYAKILRPSEKAKLFKAAKKDGADSPSDYIRTILADMKSTCKGADDLQEMWPEVYAFLAEGTGGDQGALNEEADIADLAIDTVKEEEMPKDGQPRNPNAPQDEATSDSDFQAKEESTDLPISKAKVKVEADKCEEGMEDCPSHDKKKMRHKKGPRVVHGPEEKAGMGMGGGAPMATPSASPAPVAGGPAGVYSAQFVAAEKAPTESYWLIRHADEDILKIQANKALEDLGAYTITVEEDGQSVELTGLEAFGSQHYKTALLAGLDKMGAQALVDQEFGGAEGGFVEVLAQALPVQVNEDVGGTPEGLSEAPDLEDEGAGPANLEDEVSKDLLVDEEEQSPIVDTMSEILAQMIVDNEERTVDEVFDELQTVFADDERSSEFHGMLEEKVKDKEEREGAEEGAEEGLGMEGMEEMGMEGMQELAKLRQYKATVEQNYPILEARLVEAEDENGRLHAQLSQSKNKDRVIARATRAAQAVETLVDIGYIEDASSEEARKKVEELAQMDGPDFEREIAHVAELSKKLPKIAAKQAPAKNPPKMVTAAVPHPAQEQVGIGLKGDGTEADVGSGKSYADLWERPPQI